MKTQTLFPRFILATLLVLVAAARVSQSKEVPVTNTNDGGAGSLRQAIAGAMSGDTITFSLPPNSSITLMSGELLISKSLTINGPGANQLAVRRSSASGTPNFRIFNITGNINVAIMGLTVADGFASSEASLGVSLGGGISVGSGSTLTLSHSTVTGNTVSAGGAAGGGGISNEGTLTVANSTISGNRVSAPGFSGAGGGSGGGIFNAGALTVTNSTIADNSCNTFGCGLFNNGGNGVTADISNTTISGNGRSGAPSEDGGGILNYSTLTIINSTVTGNSSSECGGICNQSTLTIINSTVTDNSATNNGGGILNGDNATLNVKNTIIAMNSAPNGPDVFGPLTSNGFNLIGNKKDATISSTTGDQIGGSPGSTIDPKLGPLQNNGGPTQTHALLSGSSAIEGGHSSGSFSDQRGLPRRVDDPGIDNASGGDGSDIGAYEVQPDQLPGCKDINRVVKNKDDIGKDSLRAVIASVCPGSTITFADNVRGAINLTSGELVVNKSLTISGPGANLLSVQRKTDSDTTEFRIFHIGEGNFDVTLSGLTVANGKTAGNSSGGGIANQSRGTLTVTGCAISGNTASGSGTGGGIFNLGTMTLTSSTISGNSAPSGGGIENISIPFGNSTLTITNSTLSGNSAAGNGAGIENFRVVMPNQPIPVGTVNLTNSTISGNPAGNSGGGIFNQSGNTVNVRNTIIALNTAPTSPDVQGSLTTEGFNLIGNGSGVTITPAQSDRIGATAAELKLGPLQNNGGPTMTHALISGSVAIDRGHASGATTDQRGLPRPYDIPAVENAPGSDGSDIGAFELSRGVIAFSNVTYQVNEGAGTITFNVVRSGGSDGAVSAVCTTGNGSAQAGSDYVAKSATVSFGPGETAKTFTVTITEDALDEADETFTVTLSTPAGGAILGAPLTRTATILDNDALPLLSINNVTVPEGDTGTVNASFAVTLNKASGRTVTVHYATANGTATAGSDYTAVSGTLSFSPGQTSRSISVPVKADTVDEPNETFDVNLSSPLNASIFDSQGNGTITDNDPPPTPTPGLVANVSTRLPVGTGDNVLIEGFIVQGPAGSTKKIMVRAIGPSLKPFGVTDAVANPTLEIKNASKVTVARNNDWKTTQVGGIITGNQFAEINGSGLAPSNDLESAIIANLTPGSYTAVVRGVNNTVGTGVVDAYDLSPASPARLANVATRGLIQPDDKLMIAGFIIQKGQVRAVVRAIGPSLTAFGIANALPDTTLQLRNQNGAIVRENDDWQSDPSQKQELQSVGLQPSHNLEAALITTLQPGQYTAQVRGKGQTSGIGVVQVYFLQ